MSMDQAQVLVRLLESRPGPHIPVLRVPDGDIEPPLLRTGLTPKDEAEIRMVIGDCLVSWDLDSFDAAELVR